MPITKACRWPWPPPQAGNQHDTFELERVFTELYQPLETSELRLEGLSLNAHKAFDVSSWRQACARRGIEVNIPRNHRAVNWQTDDDTSLDPERYRHRLVIERLNAWLDSFKVLLVRYETSLQNWLVLHWLVFIMFLLRKIAPPSTS